jgi:hypothetical protein
MSAGSDRFRLFYPIQMLFIMASLTITSSILSATVEPFWEYYHNQHLSALLSTNTTFAAHVNETDQARLYPTKFAINVINFIPAFVYLPIALCCRFSAMKRWKTLLLCTICTLAGLLSQSLYTFGYQWMIVSAFFQGIPQPFIVSTLLVVATDYFGKEAQSQMIGWYNGIMNAVGGLAFYLALDYIETAKDLNLYDITSTVMYHIMFGVSVVLLFGYFCGSAVKEWDQPLDKDEQQPLSQSPPRDKIGFYLCMTMFCLLMGSASVLDEIIEQLFSAYDLSPRTTNVAANLYMIPGIPCSILTGVLYDQLYKRHKPVWILAFLVTVVQLISQIGIFYYSNTAPAFLVWVTLFSMAYGSIPVVYLPILMSMYDPNLTVSARTKVEEQTNRHAYLGSTFCLSLAVFVFWWPNADIHLFGTVMLAVALLVGCILVILVYRMACQHRL